MPLSLILSVFTGGGLVSFLITVLIIAVVIYVVKLLIDWMAIPDPIRKIIWIIIAVIVIFWLLSQFTNVRI